jgi:hypothetical protein
MRHSITTARVTADRARSLLELFKACPALATLPETSSGPHCRLGGRSVAMRGERLPTNTRWHGAPVLAT